MFLLCSYIASSSAFNSPHWFIKRPMDEALHGDLAAKKSPPRRINHYLKLPPR